MNPLDKYAKPAAPATSPVADTTPIQVAQPAANPLAAKLAELNSKMKPAAQQLATPQLSANPLSANPLAGALPGSVAGKLELNLGALKAATANVEVAQLQAKSTEVPAEIFTLSDSIHKIEGFQAQQFSEVLASTYRSLHSDQANLATMLEAINKNLRQYEELSYLLTEAQLGLYFQGLMKVTGTRIVAKPAKKTDASLQLAIAKSGGQLDLSSL